MIEAKTKYTPEMHKDFLLYLFFRGPHYRYKQKTFTMLGILLIVLWGALYFTTPFSYLPVVLLAVGIFVLLWAHLVPALLSKQNTKEVSSLMQTGLNILFNENDISISSEGDSSNSASKMRYNALYKVCETSKAFYVFLTPVHAFLISKTDFLNSTPNDFRSLLQTKIGDLFEICR